MARIDIKSAGATLSDGVLQLENGVAMDATLRNVADQNNTTSPLKLSTTAVQVVSPLRVTTDDPSDMYLDLEDGSANNRFNITRNTASQQVNLNFASNPAGGTTTVGAIRTYKDGVNLSEVMSFREDGNVGIGTNSPAFPLDVSQNISGNLFARLQNTNAGGFGMLLYAGGGVSTYTMQWADYSGSGGGRIYPDGVYIGQQSAPTARLQVRGSGSTSATTSLLVQNSGATQLFRVYDDGTTDVGASLHFYPSGLIYTNFGSLQLQGANRVQINNSEVLATAIDFSWSNNNFLPSNSTRNNFQFVGNGSSFTNSGAGGTSIGNTISIPIGMSTSIGDVTLNHININGTINTTAGTTLQRGFYYNPTLTGTVGFIHRAIQTTSGGAYINTTTPQDSACLQADSTTQGFLPPRMTNAQRTAITSPAVGLMVYCTDAVEGLYVYKSTGWTFVI